MPSVDIYYITNFITETTLTKSIHSQEIKKYLSELYVDIFTDNSNKTLKQKLNMVVYGLHNLPKCSCGNSLRFVGESKASIYITRFGGWQEFCSHRCSRTSGKIVQRRKQTCLDRYGVDSYAKSDKFKDDFSVEWSQTKKDLYNIKRKQTCLDRYGEEHFSKTPEYLEKRSNTCLELYGIENTFQLSDKVRVGQFNSIGAYSWLQTPRGKEYLHSDKNPLKDRKLIEKSVLNRFLNVYKNVNPVFVDILINKDVARLIEFLDLLFKSHNKCKYKIAEELGISYSTLCRYIRDYELQDRYASPKGSPSKSEIEVYEYVKSLEPTAKHSDRTILNGKELDVLILVKNLAIEFNGIYYHSEYNGGKDKNYHLRKTELCEKQGIQLLHIFENEWSDKTKQAIWKSIIKQKMGLTENRIFARKTVVQDIEPTIARQFLELNHLSGFVGAKYHKGLYYNNILVSVISIGKNRFDSDDVYEIIRFATILNTTVIGGLSKLLKSFDLDKPLMTYADRRISSRLNSCYSNIFANISVLSPNWYGFSTKDFVLNHRLSYTKSKMKYKLEFYDDTITVFDNMIRHKYDRIWDCGNLKFF